MGRDLKHSSMMIKLMEKEFYIEEMEAASRGNGDRTNSSECFETNDIN